MRQLFASVCSVTSTFAYKIFLTLLVSEKKVNKYYVAEDTVGHRYLQF